MTKPYWTDGKCTIYHGDCREILPTLDTKAALVLTDPPFSIPAKHHAANGTWLRSWGDLLVMEPFFLDVFRLINKAAPHGQVYVHCDGESYPVFYKAALDVWPYSQLIVWYKPTGRRGAGWKHSHELVLHLRDELTEYTEGFRQDVIGIMPVRTLKREHPAEKPGSLLSFLMEGSPPGGLVLDPFMGSGTTLRAAKDDGRPAIGIEIEERYCEVAANRMSQAVLV